VLGNEGRVQIRNFEDLIAWQKSRELSREIYLLTNAGAFAKDFGLRDQIRRASVSIASNIAEGFDRSSRTEFHRFIVIAKASCAEVQSQLYIALDVGYLTQDQFDVLLKQAKEVSRILGGLRASLKKESVS
jgi:four helix bundle protein